MTSVTVVSGGPSGHEQAASAIDDQLAAFVDQRDAEIKRRAREARDRAAAAGTLAWDPFDPKWREDPFAVYQALRRSNPVHRSPLGFWVFTRHGDCLAMLRDRRSSSDARKADPERFASLRSLQPAGESGMLEVLEEMAPFLFRDPPDHTRLRGLVQKAFTPRVVESLRGRIGELCNELLDALLERGGGDLVAGYAYPLPVQVIVEMLGVPPEDHETFRSWSEALARGLDPDFLLPPEAVHQRVAGILNFVQYFAGLIERRRAEPGEDLLSRLIAAEEEGQVLSQGELLSTCILLLVAGHETTVNLISGGLLALMEHPDQLERLRAEPGLARSAVEELLRYVSPVQLTGRIALEPIEVGGVELQAGEFTMLLIGSANRDEDVFARPDELDLGRADNPHLGFGFGLHHCIGAPLARLEAQIAFDTILRRAELGARTGEIEYKENIILRGLASLPVELAAR
ncbi:MAG TPA: cytochrome P450 [Acidimicrobiales bacterium]|nr:cytochrome P450 [Acidimicrobiales bacterium]